MSDGETDRSNDDQRDRLLDGALELVGRWGVSKTSMTDVAREAGCSRATVYRAFPGGKQELFTALTRRELAEAVREVIGAFELGDDLGDSLTRALVVAARLVEDHTAARHVLENEPELILPYLGFGRVGVLHRLAIATFAPTAATRVHPDRAPWLVEWAVRTFISYVTAPDPEHDLTDIEQARTLVERFILPAFTDHRSNPALTA